jgi:hypothetical protein
MDELTRRKLEMGKRALQFCRAHPDSNPQWIAAVARLEALLARAEQLEAEEKKQMKQAENGKVLPFEKPSKGDPTDPAA